MQSNLELINLLKPKVNKYIQIKPTPKQAAFLLLDCRDAFFGGSAGCGKSLCLLAAALQYIEVPTYNALLIRDSFANLAKPEGLMDVSFQWLKHHQEVKWKDATKTWEFPSGATLSFGHLDGPKSHFNYQGAGYQFIGIDEVVAIPKFQAMYLFSRQRRDKKLKEIGVPIRFRCTSNPPTSEQMSTGAWVKERYVDPRTRKTDIVFIPARMDDNPYLDAEEYRIALSNLDNVTRKQLEEGDWEIAVKGRLFDSAWFEGNMVDLAPDKVVRRIRYWDLAATEASKRNRDPDYTAGVKLSMTSTGVYYIEHVMRFRKSPAMTEATIRQIAELDGKGTEIYIEQESGSSGKITIDHYIRNVLRGYAVKGQALRGVKAIALSRVRPTSSAAEAGLIYMVRGQWNQDFLDELTIFPSGNHDDMVASFVSVFALLAESGSIPRLGFF